MTLSWFDVGGALLLSSVLFYFLYLVITNCCNGNRGKFVAYLIFGVIGLIGWIFANFVRKETFLVESCTRCDFQKSTKLASSENTSKK